MCVGSMNFYIEFYAVANSDRIESDVPLKLLTE